MGHKIEKMINKILIIAGFSLLMSIVVFFCMMLLHNSVMQPLVEKIMKVRGTTQFEGEERATEWWNISREIIFPIILIISTSILIFIKRKNKF